MACPNCKSTEHTFRYDDYDYDGYDNIHTWDVVECDNCNRYYNINEVSPYDEELK